MKLVYQFQANLRKQAIQMKRYAPNTIAMVLTVYIIFISIFAGIQLIGNPETQAVTIQYTIINYIFWYLAMMLVNGIGYQIMSETSEGTFEQLGMTPSGIWRILSMRLLGEWVLHSIMVVLLLFLSMLTTGQWLNIDIIAILPIFLITSLSMYGLSFVIAGLTIVFKQIQALLQIFQFVLAGLAFVSLSSIYYQLFLPITKGIAMIRAIMIDGYQITDFSTMDFTLLIGNALIYIIIGLSMYLCCESYAMKKGLLAHY
ncbi:ABC-2 type transport system permease protein [Amphibacillus marinus]|uniref:ABC-2 type transport system permease protein n=1 Tax=Amphibacillus marinus TaxID=872970 RepID=A0A1H8ILP6_9BACI|nr:ABC transporter [Amphibacillus marinus]SEN69321.1 ABC-2 type transport system permease protein [Amphibacillus marinus]